MTGLSYMRYGAMALLVIVLTGCNPGPTTADAKVSGLLLGTWQWIRLDQKQVRDPFYIRFYSDGRAATWPALRERVYHVEGGFLIIRSGTGPSHVKLKMRFQGDELTMIGSGTNRFTYHRVVPDLRPGQFLPGQVDKDVTPQLIIKLLRPGPAP